MKITLVIGGSIAVLAAAFQYEKGSYSDIDPVWVITGMATAIVAMAIYIVKTHLDNMTKMEKIHKEHMDRVEQLHTEYSSKVEQMMRDNQEKNEKVIREVTDVIQQHTTAATSYYNLLTSLYTKDKDSDA